MTVVVTGSIATDYLMVFPGRFREQLVDGRLDVVSLSFLIDELEMRRGGVGANIAFGLGHLGHRPVLLGAAGEDFVEHREWLERHNVDTRYVRISRTRHTARFLCTADSQGNQIASFYAGAMHEAREIDVAAIGRELGDVELVVIGPDDPVAMLRHTRQCRDARLPFAAAPSQQLAQLTGENCRELIVGARYVFTNEDERDLLLLKTGWSAGEIRARIGTWVTTGDDGILVESPREHQPVSVPEVRPRRDADHAGAEDALRAGFLAGICWGLGVQRAAQLGCTLAAVAVEAQGPQEYDLVAREFVDRFTDAYGFRAAAEVSEKLRSAHTLQQAAS
ncbi:MAG: carbohydrate kinase family protein [Pseudonocardiaceae bacterium]|nr:carbohydrate kinase family protein [Pseudonocardiaceae bacterium]